jgi:hypothetical protein
MLDQMSDSMTPFVLGDPRFIYAPLWDATANDVHAYRCTPLWQGPAGTFEPIEALGDAFVDPADLLSVDVAVFSHAIEQVNRIVAAYGVVRILIPVHLTTLIEPEQRDMYLEIISESVWSVFDNVCFEIVETGADVSAERLAAAVATIRPYGSDVFVCLDADHVDRVPHDDDVRPVLVGRNVRRIGGTEDIVVDALQRFAAAIQGSPFRSYVHGIVSLETTASAIGAGYTFIGSHAIAPPLEEPGQGVDSDETARMLRTLMKAKSST